MRYSIFFLSFFFLSITIKAVESDLQLALAGKSNYQILIPENTSVENLKAAEVLQSYFYKVTQVKLSIRSKVEKSQRYISLGHTVLSEHKILDSGFKIYDQKTSILILGDADRGLLTGVYYFIEHYLDCHKWAPNEVAECPTILDLKVPLPIAVSQMPAFQYSEVYSTAEMDAEYRDWYQLDRLDDLWGIWGHSYNQLVSPKLFKTHPEYFSFIDGRRRPNQLCLSNSEVLKLTIQSLEEAFKGRPGAKYWSISPNDATGYCTCDLCQAVDDEEGGPQGSLIRFINKIAKRFPDKTFTTLAYGATLRPTLKTKPAANVIIFLSNIDSYKNSPVSVAISAKNFRSVLKGWLQQTPNVFVWDYYTQFTNYLAPFPDILNIDNNINYYKDHQVKGLFTQMGGNTYVDQNDLKTYMLSKKLSNPTLDGATLMDEFLLGYYGKAAPRIKDYILDIHQSLQSSGSKLDIYGNPVNDYNSYLSPEKIDFYSELFDQAETLAKDPVVVKRIEKLRLAFEYTYLQQTRFYGLEKNGIFTETVLGKLKVREGLPQKVKRFVKQAQDFGVKELSEGGESPKEYEAEWQKVFEKGLIKNLALGSVIKFDKTWLPEYPAKKEVTLTDGMYGFKDFSYNWLLFEDGLSATVDLLTPKQVSSISASFLEDQRHWIFLPKSVEIAVSLDGVTYRTLPSINFETSEHYDINTHKNYFFIGDKIRYIKIKALPLDTLPEWKESLYKKPLIATDEIWMY